MLILTRRVGESVFIGDDVIVTVVEITGNRVRVGIDAPQSLTVNRREVSERIKCGPSADEAASGRALAPGATTDP